jgi:hypothetical protein
LRRARAAAGHVRPVGAGSPVRRARVRRRRL